MQDADRGTAVAAEVRKFGALAGRWWDPDGPMKPLHRMNPLRTGWIADRIAGAHGRQGRDLSGLTLLDVGCGAGLAAEAFRRMGATVTGLDAAGEALDAAREHAAAGGLDIAYREGTPEALAAEGARFDAVLALEVIEHVEHRAAFLSALAALARPGGVAPEARGGVAPEARGGVTPEARGGVTPEARRGVTPEARRGVTPEARRGVTPEARRGVTPEARRGVTPEARRGVTPEARGGQLFLSTLNRTARSFVLAKVGAEYVLRMLPVGTHDWRMFVTPGELGEALRHAGLRVTDVAGMSMDKITGRWRESRDLGVNYLMMAER